MKSSITTEDFKRWVDKNNIQDRTFENFKKCFEDYRKEYIEEFNEYFSDFDYNYLEIHLEGIDLRIKNPYDAEGDKIISNVFILYNNNYVGKYKLIFNLSGDIIDDVFVLE